MDTGDVTSVPFEWLLIENRLIVVGRYRPIHYFSICS
jgi:hypothetical protein